MNGKPNSTLPIGGQTQPAGLAQLQAKVESLENVLRLLTDNLMQVVEFKDQLGPLFNAQQERNAKFQRDTGAAIERLELNLFPLLRILLQKPAGIERVIELGDLAEAAQLLMQAESLRAFLGLPEPVEAAPQEPAEDQAPADPDADVPPADAAVVTWSESADAPYFCVEPWMGPPNAPEHKLGLHLVPPGETEIFAVSLTVR